MEYVITYFEGEVMMVVYRYIEYIEVERGKGVSKTEICSYCNEKAVSYFEIYFCCLSRTC